MADYAPPTRRLTPPSGVSTGGRLTAPKSAAASRPAPVKKPAKASRLLKLALAGETAYNFANKLSGNRLGEYEDANGIARFAADTFLSPVGLASTILAPVTGGASLGLRGAGAVAARGATRLGAELAVNAGAAGAGRLVEEALPEDSPGWARAAAMMVGAVAGGAATSRAISRASGITSARAAIEKGYVVDRQIDNAISADPTAAATYGSFKHMPALPSFSSGVDEVQARQIGTSGPLNKAKRALNDTLGISPFSNRSTAIGAVEDFAEKRRVVNEGIPQEVLAKLFPAGRQNSFVEQGPLWQVADGTFVPSARIIADKNAVAKYGLTPEQAATRKVFKEIKEDGDSLLRSRGIKLPSVDLGKDMDYWPHYSTANVDGDFRRAADRGKTRQYKDVETGMANGVKYADAMSTAKAYMSNVLEEVRLKDVEDEIASRVGITVDQALIDTKLGRFQALRGAAAQKRVEGLKKQIEREITRNKYAKGQAGSELKRLQIEIRDLRAHENRLSAALRTSASAEHPAPRRPTNPARKQELATAKEKFAGDRESILEFGAEPDDLVAAAAEYKAIVNAGGMTAEQAAALLAKRAEYSEELRSAVDSTDGLRTALAAREAHRTALQEAAKAARSKGGNVPMLEKKLEEARAKLDRENHKWTELRNHTWDRLPGGMFGRGEENIPVALWNQKYYVPRDEDYSAFAQKFDGLTGRANVTQMPKVLKAAEHASNLARFTAATADFAGPFTQGLALLAHSPAAWGKMAGTSFKAFFDPSVQGRYIQRNRASIEDMLTEGRVPGGEIEIFKAIEKDGLARYLKEAPVLGGGLTRFQRSYDTMLMVTRHELWNALLPVWKGEKRELGDYIKKATGGLDPRSIGVGPNRQAVESMTFFAPRMLRSTLALTAAAMKPWTNEGQMAAQTLMRLSAGMAGVMMLANIAYGGVNGESEEEIEQRLDGAINPLDGRKFLSIPIGDHYYGVGGQVRGITQLLAKAATNPKSLLAQDALENPLIRFAEGRLSPAANTGLGVAELMTDEEHNFLPFNTVDSVPDLVGMSLGSALPFAIQGASEEGWEWSNPATYAHPFVTASTEMGGIRASMFTPKDVLDKSAYARYGLPFDDLTDEEQTEVEGMNPDLEKTRNKLGDKNSREYHAEKVKLDDEASRSLNILQEQLASGGMDPRQYREARAQVLRDRSVALDEAQAAYDIEFGGVDSNKRRLINDFFATYDEAEILPGQVDWDLWEEKQEAFQQKVSGGAYGPPARAQQILDERKGFEASPDDWFEANAKIIRDADYWGEKERAFPRVAAAIGRIDPSIKSLDDLERALLVAGREDPKLAARLGAYYHLIEKVTDTNRRQMRLHNPALDRALLENGHTTKVLTRAAMGA